MKTICILSTRSHNLRSGVSCRPEQPLMRFPRTTFPAPSRCPFQGAVHHAYGAGISFGEGRAC